MSTPETPAEVLRRAAGLMRERLAELPPSPWRAEGRDVMATQDYHGDDWNPDWDFGFNVAVCRRQDEAEHIASWSSSVALAVAEWLETEAHMVGIRDNSPEGHTFHALKIARAYLSTPVTATSGQDISSKED